MEEGDLLVPKEDSAITVYGSCPLLVVYISKTKKTWHRKIIMMNLNGTLFQLNWLNKHMFSIISSAFVKS